MITTKIDICKLFCEVGYHQYSASGLKMQYLRRVDTTEGPMWMYKVRNKCVRCGYQYDETIFIPVPTEMKKLKEKKDV